jgi:hypothetical protein
MIAMLDAFTAFFFSRRTPWWLWPGVLVAMAVVANGLSLFFQPLGDEWVAFPGGTQFGDTCAMIMATGQPCPQCGMTRAWVHAVRGDLIAAWFYSPSGLLLLAWVNAAGLIGVARLVTQNPRKWELPTGIMMGWVMFWLFPMYIGTYVLRLIGLNPLP